jgi:hypothetical protein
VRGGPPGRASLSFYSYGEYGERSLVNYAGQPCRINTYGDSFTACGLALDVKVIRTPASCIFHYSNSL